MWTITLPMIPLSMNERERTHWATRKRELEQITNMIVVLASAQKTPRADGRRAVTVTIHKSLRSRVTDDPANRDSRAKSILDALVKTHLLIDDSDKWLDWGGVIEGERRATKETVITIEDAA